MSLSDRLFAFTKRPFWYVYILGVLVLVILGYLWWSKVFLDPQRVFWGMINNSLTTQGVTIETKGTVSQTRTVQEMVQTAPGISTQVNSLTILTDGKTQVKTEVVSTDKADYTRYVSIKTDQKDAQGKPLNVAKVVNIWAKGNTSTGQTLMSQAVLGVGLPIGDIPVVVGYVSQDQRTSLLEQMQIDGLYSFSSSQVKKQHINGRLMYVYNVKVQSILLAQLLKSFALDIGMNQLNGVDPNTFATAQPLNVQITVDALSRQLVSVSTPQFGQSYVSYGLSPTQEHIPAHYVSATRLQTLISQL